MMPVSELRLDPLVPIPDHVAVQHVYEPVHRNAREAAFVEELLLETAEEPLRGRVVRTASLRAHRTRQTMLLADADPLGPPVVAAAVVPEKLRTLDHGRPWSDDQFASTRLSSNRDMSR